MNSKADPRSALPGCECDPVQDVPVTGHQSLIRILLRQLSIGTAIQIGCRMSACVLGRGQGEEYKEMGTGRSLVGD